MLPTHLGDTSLITKYQNVYLNNKILAWISPSASKIKYLLGRSVTYLKEQHPA